MFLLFSLEIFLFFLLCSGHRIVALLSVRDFNGNNMNVLFIGQEQNIYLTSMNTVSYSIHIRIRIENYSMI